MHLEVSGLRIPSQPSNHMVSSLMMSSITQPDRGVPNVPPTRISLMPNNSDVTGAIHKGQRSNSGKSTRVVMLCMHFISSKINQETVSLYICASTVPQNEP